MNELIFLQKHHFIITNSQSTLLLIKNPVHHKRSKHIEVKFQFIKENLSSGEVIHEKINAKVNPSDMDIKILSVGKFKLCLSPLNIDEY